MAAVLDVAEDGAERPGRAELLGDVGEGVRHRRLDGFDGPLEYVIQVVEDRLPLGEGGRGAEQKRAGEDAGSGEEKAGFLHGK